MAWKIILWFFLREYEKPSKFACKLVMAIGKYQVHNQNSRIFPFLYFCCGSTKDSGRLENSIVKVHSRKFDTDSSFLSLWNMKINYRFHRCSPLKFIHKCFNVMNFNIILQVIPSCTSRSLPLKFADKNVACISYVSHPWHSWILSA